MVGFLSDTLSLSSFKLLCQMTCARASSVSETPSRCPGRLSLGPILYGGHLLTITSYDTKTIFKREHVLSQHGVLGT